jgi:hypothetical protein
MAKPGFYNDNQNRAYPLTFCPGKFFRDCDGMLLDLPENSIVDLGILMGLDSQYVADEHSVYLHKICRSGDIFYFEFQSTAPGTFGRPLVFTRHLDDLYLTEDIDDTADTSPCSLPLSEDSAFSSDSDELADNTFDFNPEENLDGYVDGEEITSFTESGPSSLVATVDADSVKFYKNVINERDAVNFYDAATSGRRLEFPNFSLWDDVNGFTIFTVYRLIRTASITDNEYKSDAGILQFGTDVFIGSDTLAFRLALVTESSPEDVHQTTQYDSSITPVISNVKISRPDDDEWVIEAFRWVPGGRTQLWRNGILLLDEAAPADMDDTGLFYLGRNQHAFVTVNSDAHAVEMARCVAWDAAFSDTELSDKFDIFSELYGIELGSADAPVSADSVSSDESLESSIVSDDCFEEPAWSGYMVNGNLTPLAEILPPGCTLTAAKDEAPIEPALVRSLVGHYARTLNLANDDRTRADAPEGCPDIEYDFPTGQTYIQAECLFGQPRLKAGYNAVIIQDNFSNVIDIGASVGAGEGEPCEEVPLFDAEVPPDGKTTLDGANRCNEAVRSINGVGGRILNLRTGIGASILNLPELNKIVINVDMNGLAVCFSGQSDDPDQSFDSC